MVSREPVKPTGNWKRRSDLWPPFWRRRPLVTASIALLVAVVVAGRVLMPIGSDHDRYHNRFFMCVRVVDGDTIDIDAPDGSRETTRVRLWGVDTPETARSDRGAMYYGAQASAFAKSCVEGKQVRIVLAPTKTRGKYGRLLAYVYSADSDTMLNEELITRGFGYADTRFDHVWRTRFLDLEKRARKQGVGLWADVTLEQMPEWRQRYEQWRSSDRRPVDATAGPL